MIAPPTRDCPSDTRGERPGGGAPGQAAPSPFESALTSPWAALALVTLVRALVFPFAWNLYGDAPARVQTVLRWLDRPFFLRSFEGARQFGPLNVYLLAALYRIVPDRFVVPRLLSLALGSLSAWPLYRLAERRFGRRAAAISSFAFALYGLHIQTSTTATSEGLFLFFLLWALAFLDRARGSARWLAPAALAMACACATRYDGWLYAPLSCLWLIGPLRARRVDWRAALGYATAVAAVPAFLMWGNWKDMGDPLFLVHFIDADHLRNAARASAAMGRWRYAAYCLVFWPANLLIELSPLIAAAAALAIFESVQRARWRGLWLLALVPAALFSVEGALGRFHPLARFTIPTAVLLLPYVGRGVELLLAARSPRARTGLAIGIVALALGFPAYFAWRTEGRGDPWADALRPLSPVSNLPPDLEAAAHALTQLARGRQLARGGRTTILVDSDDAYDDLPLAFYVRQPENAVLELRERTTREALRHGGSSPDLVAVLRNGQLLASVLGSLSGTELLAFGRRYRPIETHGRVEIFAAE